MKKLLFATALFLLPAMSAQATPTLPPPPTSGGPVTTGTAYFCVGVFSFILVPNVRQVPNAHSCVKGLEFLQTLLVTAPAPGASVSQVCSDYQNTGGDGSFNIDAICPAGDVALGGGYVCFNEPGGSGGTGSLALVQASENIFFGASPPTGWQTVGKADLTGSTAGFGSCRVCASCEPSM
jgi:hypothetical protein